MKKSWAGRVAGAGRQEGSWAGREIGRKELACIGGIRHVRLNVIKHSPRSMAL